MSVIQSFYLLTQEYLKPCCKPVDIVETPLIKSFDINYQVLFLTHYFQALVMHEILSLLILFPDMHNFTLVHIEQHLPLLRPSDQLEQIAL